jgi:hypothetical protein
VESGAGWRAQILLGDHLHLIFSRHQLSEAEQSFLDRLGLFPNGSLAKFAGAAVDCCLRPYTVLPLEKVTCSENQRRVVVVFRRRHIGILETHT